MINNLLSIISPCSNQPGEVWNSAHFSIGCGGLVFFINQWPVGKGHLLLGGFNMIFISLGSSQLFPAKLHFKLIPVGRGLLPFDSHPTFMVGPFRHLIFRRESHDGGAGGCSDCHLFFTRSTWISQCAATGSFNENYRTDRRYWCFSPY